jgi:thioredoxin reductase (NADPH)
MQRRDEADIEVVVIGGGPGGLATAIYLARFCRRVLVIDAGTSRASRIPCSRNYPGFPDGVAGSELLSRMREQAQRHGAQLTAGDVQSIEKGADLYTIRWPGGHASAQRVVLATGVSDVPPRMPHLAQALQQGALRYCPVCDGYESRGRAVGIVADQGSDALEAVYVRHFTDRVTVFRVDDEVRFTAAQQQRLADAGISLVNEPVTSIRLWDGRVVVRHGDTETTVDALYGALGTDVHSRLAIELGAAHDEDGYLHCDSHQQTTVPGLYAVGDVAQGLNQISVATGAAAIAAAHIHLTLLRP